ncbi:hypothetical protein [uncultured Chryseobacterium sp.]|nr:hypothetical protein [uncultured Chryseobacterium sp.]
MIFRSYFQNVSISKHEIRMIETYFAGVGIDTPEDLEKARKLI